MQEGNLQGIHSFLNGIQAKWSNGSHNQYPAYFVISASSLISNNVGPEDYVVNKVNDYFHIIISKLSM